MHSTSDMRSKTSGKARGTQASTSKAPGREPRDRPLLESALRDPPSKDPPTPADYLTAKESGFDEGEPPHASSPSSVAAEALRSAVHPARRPTEEVPGEDRLLQVGDPDVPPLENELNGEEIPGGEMTTPDQSDIDAIGRAYGVEEEGLGELHLVEEILKSRDAKRWDPQDEPAARTR